jgi:hypothetical protein
MFASGMFASGMFASGMFASGMFASGMFASGAFAFGEARDPGFQDDGGAAASVSQSLPQAGDLFLELEFLSFHFADLDQISRGAAGFSLDLGVQITMTMVQLANPRFDSHACASFVQGIASESRKNRPVASQVVAASQS